MQKLYHKILLGTISLVMAWNSMLGQLQNRSDVEFQIICLQDSISPSNIVQFNRRIYLNNPTTFLDYNFQNTAPYTVVGTVIKCRNGNVIKECWMRYESVSYENRVISASPGSDVEDFWLVELQYNEVQSVAGFAGPNSPLYNSAMRIPLAYPYGNTLAEAARFQKDFRRWIDCKGYCYRDDPPFGTYAGPTGVNTPYPTLRGLRIEATTYGFILYGALYSNNYSDKTKYTYFRSGSATPYTEVCQLPFELYRNAETGSIMYGINYKGDIVYPPISGLFVKRECDFVEERTDDCDRPSGSSECWVGQLDSAICNYYINIPANEDINNIWVEGSQIIPSGYQPDGGGSLGKDVQDLTDTLNNYIINKQAYGKVAIDNLYQTNYGWRITVKWSSLTWDSLQTNIKKYYFKKTGCRNQRVFDVQRNELGGIVICVDDQGDYAYLPESAIKINCSEVANYTSCLNNNRFRSEFLSNVTTTIDLSKYNNVSIVVLTNTITYESINNNNVVNSGTVSAGFSENHKAPNECEYFDSGSYIKLTIPTGALVKVTYLW
ncbi:MAG: hypothetical protein IPL98_17655 [Saprospiraceae bacterium]|nr:hypothetical protein [Saprospiraceae bacterium]